MILVLNFIKFSNGFYLTWNKIPTFNLAPCLSLSFSFKTSLPLTYRALANLVYLQFLEYAKLFSASRLIMFHLLEMLFLPFLAWLVTFINDNLFREAIHDCNI